MTAGELGFTARRRKHGDVEVLRHGRLAAMLRAHDAAALLAQIAAGQAEAAQQTMARLTGNYKRGNERLAVSHPRNRR